MSADSLKIAKDAMLHLSEQADDLIRRKIELLVGVCSPAEMAEIQCKFAVTLAFSAIAFMAANANNEVDAAKAVDLYIDLWPRWLANGRDRAIEVGLATRTAKAPVDFNLTDIFKD